MNLFDKIKTKAKGKYKERQQLKALEKSAYIGEKKKVTAEKKKMKAEEAVKRGKAKARGKRTKSSFGSKFNSWADRKAKEMKQKEKDNPFKIPENYKW